MNSTADVPRVPKKSDQPRRFIADWVEFDELNRPGSQWAVERPGHGERGQEQGEGEEVEGGLHGTSPASTIAAMRQSAMTRCGWVSSRGRGSPESESGSKEKKGP